MKFSELHKTLSFKNLLKLILSIAILVQISVITYNHLSGYYVLDDWQHGVFRFLRGILLSIVAGFFIIYPDLYIIRQFNNKITWQSHPFQRVLLQLGSAIGIAVFVSVFITMLAHKIKPYTENIYEVLLYNALIYSVVNIIIMVLLEGWIYYLEGNKAQQMAETLKEELSQIKFEVLKSQINPHFMFNSLNVLSGLISRDVSKAQDFVDEFSHIYRYVLETIEIPVTNLGRELEFTRSYLFLQKIRYGESLSHNVNISAHHINHLLPPLSLQVLLENAIKHNIVNEDKPLHIEIHEEEEWLVVRNNLQPKVSMGKSTGLGLKNLVKRYALITDKEPVFLIQNQYYIAKLPMIKPENDEDINS